jgi:hypothetical protein
VQDLRNWNKTRAGRQGLLPEIVFALILIEMRLYIHTIMQNTNNINMFIGFLIKDQMPSDVVFAISWANIITSSSPVWLGVLRDESSRPT